MSKWFHRGTRDVSPGAVALLDDRETSTQDLPRSFAACPPIVGGADLVWQCDTLEQRLDPPPPAWPPHGLPPTAPARRFPAAGSLWPLVSEVALPGGALGGVPYGGGLPGDDGPLFGPDTALAEMPWRAAGGKAHPMTAIAVPGPADTMPEAAAAAAASDGDADTSELPRLTGADLPSDSRGSCHLPGEGQRSAPHDDRLPIFERLLAETSADDHPAPPDVDWPALLGASPAPFPVARALGDPEPTGETDHHWSDARTEPLPIIGQSRGPARSELACPDSVLASTIGD